MDGDAASMVAVENLAAADNRGGVLVSVNPLSSAVSHDGYPDEWWKEIRLTGLQPRATKLKWLEGDLVVRPLGESQRCEVPLPLPEGGVRRQVGAITIEFLKLQPGGQRAVVNEEERRRDGPILHGRLTYPDGMEFASLNGAPGGPAPVLLGASGRRYAPDGPMSLERTEGENRIAEVTYRYPAIAEPLVSVALAFAEREPPRSLGSFRIADIPLPAASGEARPPTSGAFFSSKFGPESPQYAAGGGTLVCPVQVSDHPAPPGYVCLGVSPGDASSRSDWFLAEVGADGLARLGPLRPGHYRVLRLYWPRDSAAFRHRGWWENGVATALVAARQEVRLPPLRLTERGAAAPPGGGGPAPAPRQDRMQAAVRIAAVRYQRTLHLLEQPEATASGQARLSLSGTGAGVAPSQVFDLRNVVAQDDRGNLLTAWHNNDAVTVSAGAPRAGFDWVKTLELNMPHPEARRLAWLEGDLLAHRKIAPLRAEFPLPLAAAVHQRVETVDFTLESFAAEPARAERDPDDPPGTGYLLKASVLGDHGTRFEQSPTWPGQVVLIGQSGAVYPRERNDDSVGGGSWYVCGRFVAPEPVVKVRFELTARIGMFAAGSFRLTDVPLPRARVFVPGMDRTAEPSSTTVLPAFYQQGGARLAMPVKIGPVSAPDGTLQVGLARQLAVGWSPLRWVDAAVTGGSARLVDLQPGTYRLLRSYRPETPPDVKVAGRWSGSEVRVTLAAGKETEAPPLSWQPER
jgi:hypothetical protein